MHIAFLGQGPFAKPVEQRLSKAFGLVSVGDAQIVVVASWGEILTKDEIERPKYGTINIHPSLLPKYRGSTPIQWSIINGDSKSGVTIIKMDEKVDHGPILAQKQLAIDKEDTSEILTQKLSKLGAQMVVKLLPQYIYGKVKPTGQDHSKATFVSRFKKEDGLLNLNDSAEVNVRKIRALWPWPGVYIELLSQGQFKQSDKSRRNLKTLRQTQNKKLFIHQAHIENGKFIPDLVQLEGRQKMSFDEFMRGWRGSLPKS